MKLLYALLLAASLSISHVAVAACDKDVKSTTPSRRFMADGGQAFDTQTRLTWSRCAVGQTYRAGKCMGSARLMTFVEATHYAKGLPGGWRLPLVAELLGIVERRCTAPAINPQIFPGVEALFEGSAKYWTRSPFPDLPGMFINVDLIDGSVDANSRGIAMGVRLVRDKP